MSAADYSIGTAGARLRDGSLTAVALVEAHLARIRARDPRYHAFVTVTAERAFEDAARADRELSQGLDRGPLHGIPIGLKDLIDTASAPLRGRGCSRPMCLNVTPPSWSGSAPPARCCSAS